MRNALVPIGILVALVTGGTPAHAQNNHGDWTIYAATGDMSDIELTGTTAWIGAKGGIVSLDLATAAQNEPVQRKIGVAEGLIDADVTSLALDSFGNVWVGTKENGISVFNSEGEHIRELNSFEHLWSDLVVDMRPIGNKMYVACTDQYTAIGGLDGGGYVPIEVSQSNGDLQFTRLSIGIGIDLAQVILPETGTVWVGTSGSGLWKVDETVETASPEVVLDQSSGLFSSNVKEIVRAPNPDQGGASVLWLGTGLGLQAWDGTSIYNVQALIGRNILDVYVQGSTMLVLAEIEPTLSRDLYTINLASAPLFPQRVARSTCFPDTAYIPREVAMDAAGRIILGTRDVGVSVRDPAAPFDWHCPPPLGPHFAQVSDLVLAPDNVLYFATGEKGPFTEGVGIGTFDGIRWGVIGPDSGLVHRDIHEVAAWSDNTMWFGSAISGAFGGLSHYFPSTGTFVTYHDTVPFPLQVTQGKNCQSLEVDRNGVLWIAYGQNGGGLTAIQPQGSQPPLVTNWASSQIDASRNELTRDLAFDSRGRVWLTTFADQQRPGTIYIVDHRATIADKSDDRIAPPINVANEIADLGTINNIEIDSEDQIWLAGEKGLVIGQIGPDAGLFPTVTWRNANPGTDQSGGRNPLPYTAAKLGQENSIWLGTETSGLVNVSKDGETWTWYDQEAGTPLPDQSVTSIYVDPVTGSIWIGTATAGIARLDLTGRVDVEGDRVSLQAYPNPWRPATNSTLTFLAIPPAETSTIRIYDLSGDLVYEGVNLTGTKTWNGKNSANQSVRGGTYLMKARSTNGRLYEQKVAIVR
jgi:ligand-binding sensor domain-containing protein